MSGPESVDVTEEARRVAIARSFMEAIPYNVALGLKVVELSLGRAIMALPAAEHLVGDPGSGAVHGGVIAALVDACGGGAVFTSREPQPIATLDLRLDYLRPSKSQCRLIAEAHCYRVSQNVAFVRGTAFHEDPRVEVASFVAAYMMGTRRGKHRAAASGHLVRDDSGKDDR